MTVYLTRNGVAKVLAHSPYRFTNVIDGNLFSLHFSSKLHLDNFMKRRSENFIMIYNDIYKRFKFKSSLKLLSDLNLYQKIETRGFYVKFNEEEFLCPDNIVLIGGSRMKQSLEEWQETSMIS